MRIWLIMLVMGFVVQGFTYTVSWGPDKRLTYNDSISWMPQVAVNGNIVHVVWWDSRDYPIEVGYTECLGKIYYKRSTNNGATWSPDRCISGTLAYPHKLDLAVSGSYVHIVWDDWYCAIPPSSSQIFYEHSTDNGNTWSSDVRLSNDTRVTYSSVAAYGSKVHVVYRGWDDNYPPSTHIKYIGSLDGGITWGIGTEITPDSMPIGYPEIAAYGSNIYVAWARNNGVWHYLVYAYSNNGIGWSLTPIVDNSLAGGNGGTISAPSIVVYDSKIHITWTMWNDYDHTQSLCYIRSTDNGINWSGVFSGIVNSVSNPVIAVSRSGLALNMAWQKTVSNEEINGNEIYHRFSTNGGTSWKPYTRLTYERHDSYYPAIAASDNYVHVVWQDFRDDNPNGVEYGEIYYKRGYLLNEIWPRPGIMGIDGEDLENFCIYPNPFINYAVIPGHESEDFMVYDISGRLLATYQGSRVGADLGPGVYFLKSVTLGSEPVRIVKVK